MQGHVELTGGKEAVGGPLSFHVGRDYRQGQGTRGQRDKPEDVWVFCHTPWKGAVMSASHLGTG